MVVYRNLSYSLRSSECKTTDVLRALAHFLPSPSETSPETFSSILSRGYRVTGLLKWPEYCSARLVVSQGRGCRLRRNYTVRFRHVANERSRATKNEKRIDFRTREARIVFMRNPSARMLARVGRILIRIVFFQLFFIIIPTIFYYYYYYRAKVYDKKYIKVFYINYYSESSFAAHIQNLQFALSK